MNKNIELKTIISRKDAEIYKLRMRLNRARLMAGTLQTEIDVVMSSINKVELSDARRNFLNWVTRKDRTKP